MYCQPDKEKGLLGVLRLFSFDISAALSGMGSGVFEDEDDFLFFLRNIDRILRDFRCSVIEARKICTGGEADDFELGAQEIGRLRAKMLMIRSE